MTTPTVVGLNGRDPEGWLGVAGLPGSAQAYMLGQWWEPLGAAPRGAAVPPLGAVPLGAVDGAVCVVDVVVEVLGVEDVAALAIAAPPAASPPVRASVTSAVASRCFIGGPFLSVWGDPQSTPAASEDRRTE